MNGSNLDGSCKSFNGYRSSVGNGCTAERDVYESHGGLGAIRFNEESPTSVRWDLEVPVVEERVLLSVLDMEEKVE